MTTDAQQETAAFWGQFLHDPIKFVGTFWPHRKITSYQREILISLTVNTETWVHSAHKMGKTMVAAMAALWWFSTRRSKVVVMSSAEKQLKGSLWGEICELLSTATFQGKKFKFEVVKTYLELRYPDEANEPDPKYFLRLMVAAKGETVAGSHLPRISIPGTDREVGTVFFIVEEASGLHEQFWEVIDTMRHTLLSIGNPVRDEGVYARMCKKGDTRHDGDPPGSKRLLRKVIKISGKQSPNVQYAEGWIKLGKPGKPPTVIPGILSYDEYLERLNNWSDEKKRTRLFGEFPEEEGQRLFPSSWLKTAQDLGGMLRDRMAAKRKPFGKPFSLGVDTSEGGGDKTAFVVWGRFGVVYLLSKETPNTAEIAGTTIQLMRKYSIKPWYVAFDSGGGGKQIADQLRDRGYEEVDAVEFGGRADDSQKYMNKRAELYGLLREAMQLSLSDDKQTIRGRIGRMLKGTKHWGHPRAWCASIPPDNAVLREDLGVLPLLRDSEGRLRMLPKEKARGKTSGKAEKTLRELLGRSPDQGDACVLAHYAWIRGREYDEAANVDGPLIYG